MSVIFSILGGLLGLFIYIAFALLPFAMFWNVGSKDTLTCKRLPSGRTVCQHQTWRLFGLRYQATEWQLQGARIMESPDGMTGDSYSLSLTTNKGEVNLDYLDNRQQAYQAIAQVREFLKGSSQLSFHRERNYSLFTNWLSFVVAVSFFVFFLGIPLVIICLFISGSI